MNGGQKRNWSRDRNDQNQELITKKNLVILKNTEKDTEAIRVITGIKYV